MFKNVHTHTHTQISKIVIVLGKCMDRRCSVACVVCVLHLLILTWLNVDDFCVFFCFCLSLVRLDERQNRQQTLNVKWSTIMRETIWRSNHFVIRQTCKERKSKKHCICYFQNKRQSLSPLRLCVSLTGDADFGL